MAEEPALVEVERAVRDRVGGMHLDMPAAHAVSSLYRAANALRNHLTQTVLKPHDLTWTGFVVLWVAWIWDDLETRHVAEQAGISKATLTGVLTTLEGRGWLERVGNPADRRRVHVRLTPAGQELMEALYPEFNAEEARVVARLSRREVGQLTRSLRQIVLTLDSDAPRGPDGR
jgi:DNA-binding MarR family transcriptional regulator